MKKDIEKIREVYEEALSDSSFVSRKSAAENYAMDAALCIVMNRHHVIAAYDVTEEMADEARQLYLSAIFGDDVAQMRAIWAM